MLIRTMKDFKDHHLEPDTFCDECKKRLIAPPVLIVGTHDYHPQCAVNLAYGILFALTGKPEEPKTPPNV